MNQQANNPWSAGLYAITIFAEDLAATRRFYEEVFELTAVFEGATSVVFKLGNTLINLLTISQADELVSPGVVARREAGARLVFTVAVDDVDAMCASLAKRGVELLNGPMDRPWGIRTASFKDPTGTIWEIAR